jgi:alpha-tubulin suppressor-like RCC1 family protein
LQTTCSEGDGYAAVFAAVFIFFFLGRAVRFRQLAANPRATHPQSAIPQATTSQSKQRRVRISGAQLSDLALESIMRAKGIFRRCGLFVFLLILGVLSSAPSRAQPYPFHWQSGTVTLFYGGPGGGTVTISGGFGFPRTSVSCGGDCSKTVGSFTGTTVLRATPDNVSIFAGWGGACSGVGATCVVATSQANSVIAYFRSAYRVVAAGGLHTCALVPAGTVTCWGRNDDAELGIGNTSLTHGAASGINNAVAIAAGGYHTCALIAGGTVTCWGFNSHGQAGSFVYHNGDVLVPTPVPGISDAVAVTAGGFHSCVIHAGGQASCWGANNHGQLGNGTNYDSLAPVAVNLALVGPLSKQIAAGGFHTCAIVAADSSVACWGGDNVGQLGFGARSDLVMPAAKVMIGPTGCPNTYGVGCINNPNQPPPSPPTLLKAQAIAASVGGNQGGFFSVALAGGNQDFGWGNNNEGEINPNLDGELDYAMHGINPSPSTVAAQMIAAGGYHTCIASWSDGVLCRGDNHWGQSGPTPNTAVHNDGVPTTVGAVGLAAGGFHTCAVIESFVFPTGPPGTVVCWGYNGDGQVTGAPGGNVTTNPAVVSFLP